MQYSKSRMKKSTSSRDAGTKKKSQKRQPKEEVGQLFHISRKTCWNNVFSSVLRIFSINHNLNKVNSYTTTTATMVSSANNNNNKNSNNNPKPSKNNSNTISSLKRSREVLVQKYYKSTMSSSSSASATPRLSNVNATGAGTAAKSVAANAASAGAGVFRPIGVTPIPVQIAIGCASACYWRGMWYIMDDQLFPDDPTASAVSSLLGGTIGLATVQGLIAKQAEYYVSQATKHPNEVLLPSHYPKLARFGSLYIVATSCVMVWRGAWMGCDIVYEKFTNHSALDKGHMTTSGVWSHVLATVGLLAFGRFSSVLGPPARISILEDLAFQAKTWKQYSQAAKWFFK
eukprot:scaffold1008_cov124-Cylindrotheca_fusiformis.AAC.2